MKNIDIYFFPNWTRKAITFTMDDGWLAMDRAFIHIVNPYGIKGSFNISSQNITNNNPDEVRALYDGHEITNHVKHHPFAFCDGESIGEITDEAFDAETADPSLLYRERSELGDGVYQRCVFNTSSPNNKRWYRTATAEAYIKLTELCKKELEEIFGEGKVKGFVWPFCRQENSEIIKYLKANYYGLRDAGRAEPLNDNFSLPSDRNSWQYNARHSDLLERARNFEALPDSGELKWFCFGVHSFDFDREGNWDDLREFCEKYGNRPHNYWYATNYDIFCYEDAVKSLEISDTAVKNLSDIDLYIKIDERPIKIFAKSEIAL